MKKSMSVLLGVGTTSLCLAAAACGSTTSSPTTTTSGSTGSSSAASNHAPLKIALITSETGLASPQFQSAPQGFLAAVAAQNAKGGINGHKIETRSSTTVEPHPRRHRGAAGHQCRWSSGSLPDSSLFFVAAKFPQQAGIPVTGGSFDGPEWGTQPYTNMFASDTGSVNPTFPVNTANGQFLKIPRGHQPRDLWLRDLAAIRVRDLRRRQVLEAGRPQGRRPERLSAPTGPRRSRPRRSRPSREASTR